MAEVPAFQERRLRVVGHVRVDVERALEVAAVDRVAHDCQPPQSINEAPPQDGASRVRGLEVHDVCLPEGSAVVVDRGPDVAVSRPRVVHGEGPGKPVVRGGRVVCSRERSEHVLPTLTMVRLTILQARS